MPLNLTQLLAGFALGALIGGLAWRAGALSPSGAWAAAVSGGLIFGFGGLPWAAVLLAFFLSSSGLSRMAARRKESLNEKFSKGAQRDWGQVLANGGMGAALAVIQVFSPNRDWIWMAFVGSLAAVNADTWATELGVLSRATPRLITTGQRVERGTSGGVTGLGYLAAAGGSVLVGLTAAVFGPLPAAPALLISALIGGLAGSTFDSFLGATVQAIYWCPACKKETERHPRHTCGTETQHLRGWPWLDNDLVNFACSAAGAAVAVLFWAVVY